MNSTDTVLDNELNNGKIVLTIDEPTRTIVSNGEVLLGVERDHKAEKIYFQAPRYIEMSDEVDLTSDKVKVYVNVTNAKNETYKTNDLAVTESDREGYVEFSWLFSTEVTETAGKIKFAICIENYATDADGVEKVQNEWHTEPCIGKVISSVHSDWDTPVVITDPTSSFYELNQSVENCNKQVEEQNALIQEQNEILNASDWNTLKTTIDNLITSGTEIAEVNGKPSVQMFLPDMQYFKMVFLYPEEQIPQGEWSITITWYDVDVTDSAFSYTLTSEDNTYIFGTTIECIKGSIVIRNGKGETVCSGTIKSGENPLQINVTNDHMIVHWVLIK